MEYIYKDNQWYVTDGTETRPATPFEQQEEELNIGCE